MTGTSPSPPREGHHFVAIGVSTGLTRTADRLTRSLESVTDLFRTVFGYRVAPGFGLNPRTQDVRTALRAFARERSPDDTVVVYHTGHADIVDDQHRLWMGDTDDPRSASLGTSELVSLLLADTPLRRLMVILDACFAGTGGAEALMAGMRAGRRDDKTLVVITASHPLEQVRAGDFAGLFAEAVHHPSTAGYEPRHLDPRGLIQHIQGNERRPAWQTVSESTLFNTDQVPPFLPNPRHDTRFHDLDLRTQLRLEQGKLREEDLREHFLPRARGVISPVESDWRFEGRDAAMRALSAWLGDRDRSGPRDAVVVVTGDMGSGKSAVLGRVVVLSDHLRRGSVPVQDVPQESLPPPGAVTAAVHARLLTTSQVLDALCAAAGVVAETLGEFLTRIGDRDLCVVIDALDEAMDPRGLVHELLRPLIDAAAKTRLRLLLGCRRHVLDGLGDQFTLVDLDDDTYADRPSVVRYARRCLTATGADSPFHTASTDLTDRVAEAIAEAAVHSFLVALITATSLALRPDLPDPDDVDWRAGLPRTAADAMRDDLKFRLGDQAQRALDLLVPLAFSRGSGLPWENVWPGLASQLSGRTLTDDDVVWLREHAGCYVVEAMSQERSVYRLYHAAMAEYVREGHDPFAVHDGFVSFLTGQLPEEEHRVWDGANPYTRRHLATHAQLAGRLDELVTDPGFLLAAERYELIAALPEVDSELARQAAHAYQRAVHRIGSRDTASYLQLAAYRVGSRVLAEVIAERFPDRAWTVRWSTLAPESPHRVALRLMGPVSDVKVLMTDPDRPALLLVSYGRSLDLVDPDTGQREAHWWAGARITNVQLLERVDGTLAVVLDARGRLTVLDARTLRQERQHLLWRWGMRPPYYFTWLRRLVPGIGRSTIPSQTEIRENTGTTGFWKRPLAVTETRDRVDVWDLNEGTNLHTGRIPDRLLSTDSNLKVVDGIGQRLSLEEIIDGNGHVEEAVLRRPDTRPLQVTWAGLALLVQEEGPDSDQEVHALHGHQLEVSGARFLPWDTEQPQLASFSKDGTIRIWSLDRFEGTSQSASRSVDRRSAPEGQPTVSTDGRSVAVVGSRLLSVLDTGAGPDGTVVEAEAPEIEVAREGAERLIFTALVAVEVQECAKGWPLLLTFGVHYRGGDWDVWDPKTGERLAHCYGSETFATQAAATEPTVSGTYVVTAGHGSQALVWRVTAHSPQAEHGGTWPAVRVVPHRRLNRTDRSNITALATGTLRGGRNIALTGDANGRVRTWSLPDGRYLGGTHLGDRLRGLVPMSWDTEAVRALGYILTERGIPIAVVLHDSGRIDLLHARRGTLLGRRKEKDRIPVWLATCQRTSGCLVAEADAFGQVRLWRLEHAGTALRERYLFVLIRAVDLEAAPSGLCFVGDHALAVTTQTGAVTLDIVP